MDEFVIVSRSLVAVGLAALLVLLRLDAERFGTAEYYESTRDGERPTVRRRLAWYGLGFAAAIGLLLIHPAPQSELYLGTGDRLRALGGGLLYGLLGTAQALGYAYLRYHRVRLPEVWSYPGALLNSTATAFIDEVTFRGAVLGLVMATGLQPGAANLIQALLYALTTRLGAPGRDRYLFLLTLAIGVFGGWLTLTTGGIAAAFLGHAVTRFAVFVCTGHTGQPMPRGRETEEIEARRRPPKGWRIVGAARESLTRER
ncbi:MAG: CPBP family intramembrane glutamic endopeptidase [Chloroflexota bacterium]